MNTPDITSLFPRFGEYVEAVLARAKPKPGEKIPPRAILELDCVAYSLRQVVEQFALRRVGPAFAGVLEASSRLSDLPFHVRLKDHPETQKLLANMLDALADDLAERFPRE